MCVCVWCYSKCMGTLCYHKVPAVCSPPVCISSHCCSECVCNCAAECLLLCYQSACCSDPQSCRVLMTDPLGPIYKSWSQPSSSSSREESRTLRFRQTLENKENKKRNPNWTDEEKGILLEEYGKRHFAKLNSATVTTLLKTKCTLAYFLKRVPA